MFNLKKALVPALLAGIVAAGSAAAAPPRASPRSSSSTRPGSTNRDDVNVRFTLKNEGAAAVSPC